ncbi:DNA-processing protein DprA [Allobranchiibius sp. CTAmp26]|uniref:DNA-processing protein DprA n=1 Tax=Allobranchiibius sp. CTAmp26 TaxID=2815214 RepID=UPI001AA10646|nr:DNA-processing protein DprA [Allobranchiibius sp. CTAmp26]MBO1756110.1 DNA-processing protein DprA [Allobranchiibius sp. CTAmp26]
MRTQADDRAARVALSKVGEPMDPTICTLVQERGPAGAWEAIASNVGGLYDRFAARVADLDLDRVLHAAERLGIRVLVSGDPTWPCGLDDLEMPPMCLWVRGPADLARVLERSVSVVGARLATAYGESVAGELAHDLAVRRFTVVSGGAYGIDTAAHRGALAGDGVTIAAMAGGVDRLYPAGNHDLLEEIARTGAVLSECPPGASPQRHRFLARNRLIAAMTPGTVVVEAGIRSGSLNTARNAERLHRVVAAVPGPVTSTASVGTNELIRQGIASLVTDAAECAELFGDLGTDLAPRVEGAPAPGDDLPEVHRRVLEALPVRRSSTVDQLTRSAGLSVGDVLGGLGALEMRGLAARSPDGWRRAG